MKGGEKSYERGLELRKVCRVERIAHEETMKRERRMERNNYLNTGKCSSLKEQEKLK